MIRQPTRAVCRAVPLRPFDGVVSVSPFKCGNGDPKWGRKAAPVDRAVT